MKLSQAGELALIDRVRRRFGRSKRSTPGLLMGIGDDCAVVRSSGRYGLLTTDMMVEGVHFDFRWTTPFQLGFKLLSVNVSDIYAMGGRPDFMLLDLAAPGSAQLATFSRIFDGINEAASLYGVSLIGGDISASDKVVLSATVTGSAARVVYRNGARVGDRLYVTGNLGDAACGLRLLAKGGRRVEIEKRRRDDLGLDWITVRPLVTRHLMPAAVSPKKYVTAATAMMDISDGLLLDLSRLCRESKVGAVIYGEDVPISGELRRACAYLEVDPLELALTGGEDYQLLFTAGRERKVRARCIGEIVPRGLRVLDGSGRAIKVKRDGYRHFAA